MIVIALLPKTEVPGILYGSSFNGSAGDSPVQVSGSSLGDASSIQLRDETNSGWVDSGTVGASYLTVTATNQDGTTTLHIKGLMGS